MKTKKKAIMSTAKRVEHLIDRAITLHKQIEKIKELYAEMDCVTEELQQLDFKWSTRGVRLVDNYESNNVVFRPAACRRFELKF